MSYRKVSIGDIANLYYGKMPDKTKITEAGYPIFTGYKVSGFYPEYNIEDNLIVVARGVGGTGDVKYVKEKSYLTNLSIALDFKDENVDKYYLLYLLSQSNLRMLDSGSAQSQITIKDLSTFEVLLSNLNEQLQISGIINSFNRKIENNNAIISNLESQAQAIFKSWFIDFEPFQDGEFIDSELGEIPKGWKVLTLGETLSVIESEKEH